MTAPPATGARALAPATAVILLALLGPASLAAAQAKADPLPTMQEMEVLYNEKQWQPLLQKTSRVLPLRGQAAQNYDRYQIYMWRGEAQLQLKANSQAVAMFKDAAEETTEPEKIATARASALLVKRSNNGKYTRKSPATQPAGEKTFDVTDPAKRKDAFVALAEDEAAALEPKAKAAAAGKSLKPIADMFQMVEDLRAAELAGTGKTDRTDGLITPLAAHAKTLTGDEVQRQKQRVDKIDASANKIIDYSAPLRSRGGPYGPGAGSNSNRIPTEKRYKKQGLLGTDERDLKDVIATCKNVESANAQLAQAFGQTLGAPLLEVASQAKAVGEKANVVLTADYSHSSSDPGGVR